MPVIQIGGGSRLNDLYSSYCNYLGNRMDFFHNLVRPSSVGDVAMKQYDYDQVYDLADFNPRPRTAQEQLEYEREISNAWISFKCGYCKNSAAAACIIGFVGRKPVAYACFTCISHEVWGKEFKEWSNGKIRPGVGVPSAVRRPRLRKAKDRSVWADPAGAKAMGL